jgi:Fe-S-cluster containining protein
MLGSVITDPAEVRRLAAEKEAANLQFRRYLHDHHHPIELFQILATEIQSQIDCTQCANCCRHTTVAVSREEIEGIARYLNMEPDLVLHQHTVSDPDAPSRRILKNEHDACVFLDGNLCLIYDTRPTACRDFPHVAPHSHTLGARFESICTHASLCPILYNALEAYKHQVGFHPPRA